MFVNTVKTIGKTALGAAMFVGTLSVAGGVPAFAADTNSTITVNVSGIQASSGPLYVSIQERGDYMSQKGINGGVYKSVSAGSATYTYDVPVGDYAVSLWHDIDNDGQFSMGENYIPTDGWGASGKPPNDRKPTFDDVKISVNASGKTVPIAMKYGSWE